jgi:ATP-dependent helicase HepA
MRDLERIERDLADEQKQVDLIEELESTSRATEFSQASFRELEDFEEMWGETAEAFHRLIAVDGGIRLYKRDEPDHPGVFSFTIDPMLRTVPLVPMDQLQDLGPLLGGRWSFSRAIARRNPGTHLVRLGDPLVDWIEQYIRLDERGRARAVWRYVPDWPEVQVWLGFDFLVEFDDSHLSEHGEGIRRRLRRRGDAFFPPTVETVWTDGDVEAGDSLVNEILDPPAGVPEGGADVSLRGPRWAEALDDLPEWSELCRRAGSWARLTLKERSLRSESTAIALQEATTEMEQRLKVLRRRAERLRITHERARAREEIRSEQHLFEAVLAGISAPRCTMIAAGAVVVSGRRL